MKKYVVILIFTKDFKKILLVKRNKKPYINCWNGIGGKIEPEETVFEAAIRECKEETRIDITNPKLLVTYVYPESNSINSDITLNILYAFSDVVEIESNYEGTYEWKPIGFAMNFNSKEIAGYSNLAQIIKEILVNEGVNSFYN
jgi:8-oxo-dGTP diphosphatase